MTTPPPPRLPRPSPAVDRSRMVASIALSLLTAAASASVLAVRVFEPRPHVVAPPATATLIRVFEGSAEYWLVPPIVALVLIAGLPRRRDLHALPAVLAVTAIGLTFLCHLVPRIAELGALVGIGDA
ncbi:hypothetical protein [Microbacterium sp. PMB16]|uniref:hypothetical protein n=1 Tax=Microbacterium sp. PMB16 TaxID=3120157 RepID=UPI003F4B428F